MSKALIALLLIGIVAVQAIEELRNNKISGKSYGNNYGLDKEYGPSRKGRGRYYGSKSSSSEEDKFKLECTQDTSFWVKVNGDKKSVTCRKSDKPVECADCCKGWGLSKGYEPDTFFGTRLDDECLCCRQKKH